MKLFVLCSFSGVDLGPAKNLSDELTCANSRELAVPLEQLELVPENIGQKMEQVEVEICACNEDLCNSYTNMSNVVSPSSFITLEPNVAAFKATIHKCLLIFLTFLPARIAGP